jgi:hypothetical protein
VQPKNLTQRVNDWLTSASAKRKKTALTCTKTTVLNFPQYDSLFAHTLKLPQMAVAAKSIKNGW